MPLAVPEWAWPFPSLNIQPFIFTKNDLPSFLQLLLLETHLRPNSKRIYLLLSLGLNLLLWCACRMFYFCDIVHYTTVCPILQLVVYFIFSSFTVPWAEKRQSGSLFINSEHAFNFLVMDIYRTFCSTPILPVKMGPWPQVTGSGVHLSHS